MHLWIWCIYICTIFCCWVYFLFTLCLNESKLSDDLVMWFIFAQCIFHINCDNNILTTNCPSIKMEDTSLPSNPVPEGCLARFLNIMACHLLKKQILKKLLTVRKIITETWCLHEATCLSIERCSKRCVVFLSLDAGSNDVYNRTKTVRITVMPSASCKLHTVTVQANVYQFCQRSLLSDKVLLCNWYWHNRFFLYICSEHAHNRFCHTCHVAGLQGIGMCFDIN